MARDAVVFDKHLSGKLFRDLLNGWTLLDAALRKPQIRYRGPFADDEDYYDVLQLAWENDALLVTCDQELIEKARRFGGCGSYDHRLHGVIVLPKEARRQASLLEDLLKERPSIVNIPADESAIDLILTNNLGVDLNARQPRAVELCDCKFDDELERHRKRYKLK